MYDKENGNGEMSKKPVVDDQRFRLMDAVRGFYA